MSTLKKTVPLLDRRFDGSKRAHFEALLASALYQHEHKLFSECE